MSTEGFETEGTAEPLETPEELKSSTVLQKINTRLESGKPADVACLDVDGTVYEKVRNSDGSWGKKGNNTELSKKLSGGNIPCILISGRPDWDEGSDREMQSLGLIAPDAVISGAGSIVYWRQQNGTLATDEEFLQIMKEQTVSYGEDKFSYDPAKIAEILNDELAEFSQSGFEKAKVDTNSGVGFATLDISEMPFENLSHLVAKVRDTLPGIKVTFSENLEEVNENSFSGWIQVLPLAGGKDGATRFVLNKLARAINPASTDAKRLQSHVLGDASIDIWMLSLGSGKKDSYDLHQYALENMTPYAKSKLERLSGAFDVNPTERERIQRLIESGEIVNVESKLRVELGEIVAQIKNEQNQARREEITSQLRKIAVVRDPARRRANLHGTTKTGPGGVWEVVGGL